MQLVDIFPAAAGEGFEKSRPADVGENRFPIERVGEVAKGLVARVRRQCVGGQEDGLWHRHADLGRERIVEKLLVGAPPKRIVDHRTAGQRFVLEPGAIERHVLRNTIDHHIVAAGFALDDFVDPDRLGHDAASPGFLVHPLNKCRWEGVFLAVENADFFHRRVRRLRRFPQMRREQNSDLKNPCSSESAHRDGKE